MDKKSVTSGTEMQASIVSSDAFENEELKRVRSYRRIAKNAFIVEFLKATRSAFYDKKYEKSVLFLSIYFEIW